MKKFLLLLVGVLFALSAKAYDWVLYVDIQNTGWITAENPNPTVYFYCGEGSSSVAYWGVKAGSRVYGTIYKFSFTWNDNKLTHGIFSTNKDYPLGGALNNKINSDDTYGELDSNSSFEKWKLTPNRLYVLAAKGTTGTDAIASYRDGFNPPASKDIYIVGDSPIDWGGDNPVTTYKLTRTGENTYEYTFSDATFKSTKEFLIVEGTSWSGKHGTTDALKTLVANTAYELNATAGDNDNKNVKFGEDIANPTVVVDVQNWTVTFKTATTPDPTPTPYTIYFDALRSGWANLEVTAGEADVTISTEGKLKKITFTAGESVNVTFKNGTKTLTATPVVNGNVYYVNADGTLNGSTAAASYTPETYSYRLHGDIFTGSWATQDVMKANTDGTYSFTANITKQGNFGIKRLTPGEQVGDSNTWIYTADGTEISATDTEYNAAIKIGDTGVDFKTTLPNGEYTIIFNPTTMKVKFVAGAVTPTSYVWRLHTNIITGSWPAADNTLADYAMTKQADGVTWVWEGRVSNSGFFGFKRLNEGDKPSNSTPWFYCNSNSDYNVAVNTPTTGKLKNGNSDTSGHDWQWNLTPGRYRISLNATNPDAPVITITALDSDYSGLVYVISGTFNGWIAPDTYLNLDKENQPFTFTYDEGTKKYVWRYTGTMKNVSFKISNMTDADTDNDPHWGKAFGYSLNGTEATVLSLDNAYQMRRTNVPGEDVFIKYQDTSNNPLTLVNPTFTLDPSNMTLVVKNNPKPEPTGTYYFLHGYWSGTGETSKALTFVGDGTYVWEGSFGTTSNRFYISKSTSAESDTKTDMLTPKKGVYNEFVETGTVTFTAAQTGIKYECLWKTDAGDKTAKWTFGVEGSNLNITTTYRLVFDPTAKTVVIYSLAPVTAQYEALESSSDAGQALGQAVNNLFVELKPSEYLPVADSDSYSLQIGGKVIANGYKVSDEGLYRFDFMPYFVNDQELTLVASASKSADIVVKSAGKIDINASVGTVWFEGSKYDNAWYATIKVPYTTSVNAVYNYPHVTYTRTDQEGSFEANVIWTAGGFTIEVPDAIEVNSEGKYTGKDITFNFNFTPVIPFAVYTAPVASSASLNAPAADATNLTLQMFGGTPDDFELKINGTTNIDVSGVEGVAVENEEAPVEYYNLQGQRVNGELAPGIYIRRQGTTVTKVRI